MFKLFKIGKRKNTLVASSQRIAIGLVGSDTIALTTRVSAEQELDYSLEFSVDQIDSIIERLQRCKRQAVINKSMVHDSVAKLLNS